ncbi:hypothetical protein J2Y55_002133 [Bosea sp. BE125]|uniref:hypothetical protein n=1 Tax=Bosea sp. BE125 TaxID=2817909 RepID=UPI00285681A9|nr:hypothetical protein [Bosea sp. BE125]MDR6871125.1 hypothetical protein [Bosea sp. BE125]
MTEPGAESHDAQHELLDALNDQRETIPTFEACVNAHGMYETMRFVLRLSPRNHELMAIVEANSFDTDPVTSEVIQAYSTYIHETIHWWQHVGSTSGLLLSLSYLAQLHSSMGELKEVLATFGPKKPLKGWTDQVLSAEGSAAQAKLASANIAVNNAIDVEYYKSYALDPRKNIRWMMEEKHFESVGHGYFVVYSQLVGMVAALIDPDFETLPKIQEWDPEILRLNTEKCEGFYWRSPVQLPAVGMQAIYEGQARFIQLQFLDDTRGESLSCKEWREMGFLSGIYVEAFEAFLKLSETEWPERMSDPVMGLFLLVCDLAINPTRGFPIDVDSFEDFILDVDVGIRFTRLCLAVKALPHLRRAVVDHSREEYIAITTELSDLTEYDYPLTGLQRIIKWIDETPGLKALMEEHRTFEFDQMNLPTRVFVSHFVAFCKDRYAHPEFFCWPGRYLSGSRDKQDSREIWLRHLSLFADRGDKDGVYPRKWPMRSEAAVKKTFDNFYGTMALYDLTRQWILKNGPFICDYRWLLENYDQQRADTWANDTFKKVFGVTLDEFEIVQ